MHFFQLFHKSVKCTTAGLIILNVLERLTHKMVLGQTALNGARAVLPEVTDANPSAPQLNFTQFKLKEEAGAINKQNVITIIRPLFCSIDWPQNNQMSLCDESYFVDGELSLKATAISLIEGNLH